MLSFPAPSGVFRRFPPFYRFSPFFARWQGQIFQKLRIDQGEGGG